MVVFVLKKGEKTPSLYRDSLLYDSTCDVCAIHIHTPLRLVYVFTIAQFSTHLSDRKPRRPDTDVHILARHCDVNIGSITCCLCIVNCVSTKLPSYYKVRPLIISSSVTTQRCQLRKHCASVVLWSAGVATRIVSLGVATVSDSCRPRKNLIGHNTDHGELTYILQYLHINVVLVL